MGNNMCMVDRSTNRFDVTVEKQVSGSMSYLKTCQRPGSLFSRWILGRERLTFVYSDTFRIMFQEVTDQKIGNSTRSCRVQRLKKQFTKIGRGTYETGCRYETIG